MKPKPIMPILPRLREMLRPDFDAGKLYWLVAPPRKPALEGAEAGTWVNGYRCVKFEQERYAVYRVLWAMYYNEEPPEMIDHEDKDATNNAISNLRDGTNGVNVHNKRAKRSNKTGLSGVYWSSYKPLKAGPNNKGQFVAKLGRDVLYMGQDLFQACCARKSAENQYWAAHG